MMKYAHRVLAGAAVTARHEAAICVWKITFRFVRLQTQAAASCLAVTTLNKTIAIRDWMDCLSLASSREIYSSGPSAEYPLALFSAY
jgi:hypothetical protein